MTISFNSLSLRALRESRALRPGEGVALIQHKRFAASPSPLVDSRLSRSESEVIKLTVRPLYCSCAMSVPVQLDALQNSAFHRLSWSAMLLASRVLLLPTRRTCRNRSRHSRGVQKDAQDNWRVLRLHVGRRLYHRILSLDGRHLLLGAHAADRKLHLRAQYPTSHRPARHRQEWHVLLA